MVGVCVLDQTRNLMSNSPPSVELFVSEVAPNRITRQDGYSFEHSGTMLFTCKDHSVVDAPVSWPVACIAEGAHPAFAQQRN